MIIFFIALAILFIVFLLRYFRFKRVVKLFEDESCCVFGARGSGKDLLMSNVCAYRNKPYISNTSYTKDLSLYTKLERNFLELGGNKFRNFADGNIIKYEYPFSDKVDIYISDCGVYFPSQYCNILNNYYDEQPLFQALLRHLGDSNLHWNCQNLNRVWDKIREQGERYILCRKSKVRRFLWFKYVVQKIIIYDRYDTAVSRVEPFKLRKPLLGKGVKYDIELEKQRYKATYGNVVGMTIAYRFKSRYNSRFFKEYLKNGKEKA